MGGGAAYSYLHTGIKLWCAATTNSSSRLLERCYNDVASFINLIQRGPRSREATFFSFHLQRPGDLIYVPPLRTHLVLTMNNVKPTVLSGCDAVYTRDHFIIKRTLDENVIGVKRTTWRNILREQGREELNYLDGCTLPLLALKKQKNIYKSTGLIGNGIARSLYRRYH